MASTFNSDQSYRKLPPIRVKEPHANDSNGKDQSHVGNTSSFSRETHGLVRLPPIIRVDGSVASPEPSDTENHKENLDNFASPKSSRINEKNGLYILKNGSDNEHIRHKDWSRRSKSLKRQVILDKTKKNNEFIKDSHPNEDDIQKTSISPPEKDKDYGYGRRGSKPVSLLGTTHSEYRRRRGSLITSETEKPLHRGRRLAKSSPDLSSSRKQYGSPTRMSDKSRLDSQLFHADNDFFRVATNQANPRQSSKMKFPNKNVTLQKQSLKSRWEFPPEPQSSPCTPVIQLTNDEENLRDQQRNSLGDIYGFSSNERKPVMISRKKLASTEENAMDGLVVKGKTCRQNKRLTSRDSSPRPKDSLLKIPQAQTKRDSLYDLEQILSLLNIESKTDARKKSSSSVYDLKEFLEMSRSTSDTKQSTDDVTTISGKEPTNSDFLSSLRVENSDNRRGSTYDLLEFLSLNVKSGGKEQRGSENVTPGNASPSHFLFPGPGEMIEQNDIRRSSAYDLIEFLSLSRQNDEVMINNNPNHSQPLAPKILESPSQGDTTRKDSVYDLEEFLSLSRKLNGALSKVQDKESSVQSTPLLSPRLPSNPSTLRIKRESIYDLQEFLGVLQKESELKRQPSTSTMNQQRNDTQDPNQAPDNETETLKPKDEYHKGRSLSIYDLREFLSLYSSQSNIGNHLQRKPSEISQSSVMINVTEDEHGNSSVDDVFLAVPVEGGAGRKRSSIASVAELNELLNIINDTNRKKNASDAPGSLTRHDSGGTKSLLDLGEFLSVLNSDDSPLRRRLSSVSDRGTRSPSSLSRNDSSGGSSLYDLEEFLAIINDNGQVKSVEKDGKQEEQGNEISIPVPQLPPRNDRKEQISHLLTEVNSQTTVNTTDGQKASVEQCL